ncbi:MAG: hypothetical protein ABW252_01430 [Polyangiales bacterium]
MSEASLHIARLEHALREAQNEVVRLTDERARLARRNLLLAEVLGVLRENQPPASAALIDQALGFDGQPWSLPTLQVDDDDDDDEADDQDNEER